MPPLNVKPLTKNQDFSAFACAGSDGYTQEGLTKREYFAGQAYQGILSLYDSNRNSIIPNKENVSHMAKLAVFAADALLAELEATPSTLPKN